MKILRIATLILFLAAAVVFSQEQRGVEKYKNRLDADTYALLEKTGAASSMFKETQSPSLLPNVFSSDRIKKELKTMNVTFGVEILKVHTFTNKADTDAKNLAIYNVLMSVSSLKGILYYSASRKRMREFIHESYRIPSPDSRTRLSDLQVSDLVPSRTIYTYQHDSSFGENTYQVTYRALEGYFLMEMSNISQVWYGIIPIVDPGKLRYYIIVIPTDNAIMFYSMICVSGANPFGIMEGKAESFHNRIEALEKWFLSQYRD
ncbi:MAG: hypothetical protein JW904_12695 [Spirochaetales bacterium]|nr:hypothetical protein [Spirochaetales bacterium]